MTTNIDRDAALLIRRYGVESDIDPATISDPAIRDMLLRAKSDAETLRVWASKVLEENENE